MNILDENLMDSQTQMEELSLIIEKSMASEDLKMQVLRLFQGRRTKRSIHINNRRDHGRAHYACCWRRCA
jgi:hypothetical protein